MRELSAEAQLGFASIPWVKMVSIRDRLMHAYFDVDLDIVWTTVTCNLSWAKQLRAPKYGQRV